MEHAGGTRAAASSATSGKAIICVEPDPSMQACLSGLLEARGFKVTTVRSAYDARMVGAAGDLVVLGPGLSGDAKTAARSTLARAQHFVDVPETFASEQSEEEMRKLVNQVVAVFES